LQFHQALWACSLPGAFRHSITSSALPGHPPFAERALRNISRGSRGSLGFDVGRSDHQQTSAANTNQQTSEKRNGSTNQQTSNKRNGNTKQQTNKRNGSTNQQTSDISERRTN